jgi:hypothetical protein
VLGIAIVVLAIVALRIHQRHRGAQESAAPRTPVGTESPLADDRAVWAPERLSGAAPMSTPPSEADQLE